MQNYFERINRNHYCVYISVHIRLFIFISMHVKDAMIYTSSHVINVDVVDVVGSCVV